MPHRVLTGEELEEEEEEEKEDEEEEDEEEEEDKDEEKKLPLLLPPSRVPKALEWVLAAEFPLPTVLIDIRDDE